MFRWRVGAGVGLLGAIPTGLHAFENPLDSMDSSTQTSLFISSISIALIGYMEAISIANTGTAWLRKPCTVRPGQ